MEGRAHAVGAEQQQQQVTGVDPVWTVSDPSGGLSADQQICDQISVNQESSIRRQ